MAWPRARLVGAVAVDPVHRCGLAGAVGVAGTRDGPGRLRPLRLPAQSGDLAGAVAGCRHAHPGIARRGCGRNPGDAGARAAWSGTRASAVVHAAAGRRNPGGDARRQRSGTGLGGAVLRCGHVDPAGVGAIEGGGPVATRRQLAGGCARTQRAAGGDGGAAARSRPRRGLCCVGRRPAVGLCLAGARPA